MSNIIDQLKSLFSFSKKETITEEKNGNLIILLLKKINSHQNHTY